METESKVLEMAQNATRRSRNTFLSLLVFSMLVTVGVYNRSDYEWSKGRLRVAEIAQAMFPCAQPKLAEQWNLTNVMQMSDDQAERLASQVAQACLMDTEKAGSYAQQVNAIRFLIKKNFALISGGDKALIQYADDWRRFRMDNVYTLPVPLVGLRIDGNSLGPVSGLGFLILLVWFGLCLNRENKNLRVVEKTPVLLPLLEGDQVFTLTERTSGATWGKRIFMWVMFWPATLLIFQAVVDFDTKSTGFVLDERTLWAVLIGEWVLVVLNIVATIWCAHLYNDLTKDWQALGPKGNVRSISDKASGE